MQTEEIEVSDFEKAIASDPGTSYWLKDQLVETKNRDVVDALKDAEALVQALQGRLDLLQKR